MRILCSIINTGESKVERSKTAIMKKSGFPTVWGSGELGFPGYHDSSAFLDGLRPVIFIGRFLGVLARSDVLSKHGTQRQISLPMLITGCLAVFFFLNAVLFARLYIVTLPNKPTSEKLGDFGAVIYTWTMFFLYAYFLHATKWFRNVVLQFVSQGEQASQFTTKFPRAYTRFCWIVCFVCMLFGISENVLYDLQNITRRGKTESPFQLYYKQNFQHWAVFIPYHPAITLIFVLIIKCGTWGWVFGDIIPIVLNKALTYKLEMMNMEIKTKMAPALLPSKMSGSESRVFSATLQGIRTDFMTLLDLAFEIQGFVVPLILSCYGVSVYNMMIYLFLWVDPHRPPVTAEQSHYAYFAFLNFLYRVTSVTYFAAEVNYASGLILSTIQLCPNALYTLSLERLEQMLACNPIGIRFFGSFMITRKSFITIISLVFSVEIVLLQTIKD